MNRPHLAKLSISVALTTLLLAGCGGGGSDSSSVVFTQCTAAGAHSSDAPSEYRLFPLLAEGVDVDSFPGSTISVTGTDNKGNALNGVHGEDIDIEELLHDEETGAILSEYRPIRTGTKWRGGAKNRTVLEHLFMFNTSDQSAHIPSEFGFVHMYETDSVFYSPIPNPATALLLNYFVLTDYEAIPPTASPGNSGSLGTYMSGGEYTLERTWSLQNAKDELALLKIQSVLYRTTDRSTVYEENISYQINAEGERQCVALYANDRESDFSIRLEGTLEETLANN